MESIIGLVREYRISPDTAEKTKAAEKIILSVSGPLALFLISHAPLEAADLRQSIFVAIIRGLDGFRGESDGEFWAWCYQIARNVVSKHFKAKETDRTISVDPDELVRLVEASSEKEPISNEERATVNDALALLKTAKPDCFALLWKRFILGFEIKEIAAELGLAFDAARMKINRCLDFTRSLLDES